MKLPDKNTLAETIRTEMARKSIKSNELAKELGISQNTMSAVRYGNASYTLLVRTINLLDDWHEADPLSTEEAIDLED
jgi:transcriptional regulator with XRE-family HTH domain